MATRSTAGRRVIDNVPPVNYMADGFCPFASSLRSLLASQGQEVSTRDIMALSGVAFRMTWNAKEWDPGNMGLGTFGPGPLRQGIRTFGYEPRFLVRKSWWPQAAKDDDVSLFTDAKAEAAFRRAIVGSIKAGMPVIAFGVVGPPEETVVFGYDKNGEVLIGWSCMDDEHIKAPRNKDGSFRKRNWFGQTKGIVVMERKLPAAKRKAAVDGALAWAYHMATHPTTGPHLHGVAAYEGWARGMRQDEAFPDDAKTIQQRRYTVWDGLIMLSQRNVAADFLEKEARRRRKVAEHLRQAAELLRRDGRIGQLIAKVLGGPQLDARFMTEPAARADAANYIRQGRDAYLGALREMHAALASLDIKVDPPPSVTSVGTLSPPALGRK
jgi:hypothetical protein